MTTSAGTACCIDTSRRGAWSSIEVVGTLNWRTTADLRSAVSRARDSKRLLIDLSEVDRMDSAGTGAVIAAARQAGQAGTDLAVLAGPAVANVVDGVGIGDAVLVFSDRAAAYAWLEDERAGYPLGR